MELFLNLCWFSLLLPAWLLWRQRSCPVVSGHRAKSPSVRPLVFLCALGCVFVLLFPVISASDDLHAMRAEMEEFSPGKRCVCQSAPEKTCHSHWQNTPAVVANTLPTTLIGSGKLEVPAVFLLAPVAASTVRASRAPPSTRLA